MKIIVLPFAEQDIKDSIAYYNEVDPAISAQFISVLDKVFSTISSRPNAFPVVQKSIRKFAIAGFPFNVYYISEQNTLYIFAVFHTKRNPRQWKPRRKI